MDFKNFFNQNISLAFGCTEPVAVAFAAAHASKLLKDNPIRKIQIICDKNIFKNGFGAGIPGSDKTGNSYAAALGVFLKEPDKGFEILSNISDDIFEKADNFIKQKRVELSVDKSKTGIYILARVYTYTDDYAVAEIQKDHLGLTTLIKNGKIIYQKNIGNNNQSSNKNSFKKMTFSDIFKFVETIPEEDLLLTKKVIDTNMEASEYGIEHQSGVKLGYTMKKLWDEKKITHSAENFIKYVTAGACDARMGGENVGVMTLCGSGNQGIAASLPVYCFHKAINNTDETKLYKALALSFLVTGYIKEKLGKLSPICGCVVASGSGAAAGICYLMDGSDINIQNSISNLLADVSGIICDGAKASCALKLSTAASSAVNYSYLSIYDCVVDESNGIIENSLEKTIENLKEIAIHGMKSVDKSVVNIFERKLRNEK